MQKPYTPYRRTLAWIGFITLYLGIPTLVILGISRLNTRTEPFYQQTINTVLQ